jgi:peptidyl-prolyl cis-trans isomerase D
MLDGLRRIGRTWAGKVLGAFLIVGLAGFGISNVLLDFGSNTVAKVGNEDISSLQFQRAYNEQINSVASQMGRVPTSQEATTLGIPGRTLEGLAAQAAVNQLGVAMGLGVSDDRLSVMLRRDPSFAGTLGTFDPNAFTLVLQRSGMTEGEYFDLQRKAARRDQVLGGLFADSAVPEAARELMARYTGDQRTVDYAILNAQSVQGVAEPTEEDLAAYLAANQERFRTEEARTIDLVVLTPGAIAVGMTISDEEIAAEYERTRDRRVRIEKRTIRWVPLTTPEQIAVFEAGSADGRPFEELAAEAGVSITELGTLARTEITDPALAEAAYSLAAGDFTLIPGIGGQRAVNVSAIEAGGEVTLEESRGEIAEQLAMAAARDQYTDILDQVEELRAALEPLSEIGERFGLKVHEVTLTQGGAELAGVPDLAAENRERVAAAAFAAVEGRLAPTISSGANTNMWIDLKGIEPARDQTLDEVRDEVAAAVLAERTEAAITAEAESIVARVKAGEAFTDVVFEKNMIPSLSTGFTRQGDGTPVLDRNVAAAVFAGGEGHVGSAVNAEGDRVVFQVTEIIPASGAPAADENEFLDETTRISLYSDFVQGLRDDAGLRVNQQAINQILALDGSVQ